MMDDLVDALGPQATLGASRAVVDAGWRPHGEQVGQSRRRLRSALVVPQPIEAIPHEEAAVVWGREVLRIRDDDVLVSQEFYDQDGVLVKELKSLEIGEMGGRTIALRQRMAKTETDDEWTEFTVQSMEFDIEISDNTFTRSNLQNPRD